MFMYSLTQWYLAVTPLVFVLVLLVIVDAILKTRGLSTSGIAIARKPYSLLMSTLRRTARFTALCALLITTGCLSFILASFAITHTLQLISSTPSLPRVVRSFAQAALVPIYSPNDFFTVARCLACWITLESLIKVYGYHHSSTPDVVELSRAAAKQAQTISSLQERLTRMRNLANVRLFCDILHDES